MPTDKPTLTITLRDWQQNEAVVDASGEAPRAGTSQSWPTLHVGDPSLNQLTLDVKIEGWTGTLANASLQVELGEVLETSGLIASAVGAPPGWTASLDAGAVVLSVGSEVQVASSPMQVRFTLPSLKAIERTTPDGMISVWPAEWPFPLDSPRLDLPVRIVRPGTAVLASWVAPTTGEVLITADGATPVTNTLRLSLRNPDGNRPLTEGWTDLAPVFRFRFVTAPARPGYGALCTEQRMASAPPTAEIVGTNANRWRPINMVAPSVWEVMPADDNRQVLGVDDTSSIQVVFRGVVSDLPLDRARDSDVTSLYVWWENVPGQGPGATTLPISKIDNRPGAQIGHFTPTPAWIPASWVVGGSVPKTAVKLEWDVQHADNILITPEVDEVSGSSTVVRPVRSTTYLLQAQGLPGSGTRHARARARVHVYSATRTEKVLAEAVSRERLRDAVITADLRQLYVSDPAGGAVMVLDTATHTAAAVWPPNVPLGGSPLPDTTHQPVGPASVVPGRLALSPDGRRLWIGTTDGALNALLLDPDHRSFPLHSVLPPRTVKVSDGAQPKRWTLSLALSADGGHGYFARSLPGSVAYGGLWRIEVPPDMSGATLEVPADVLTPITLAFGEPRAVALAPDGATLWCIEMTYDKKVRLQSYDTRTLAPGSHLDLEAGSEPIALVACPDGRRLDVLTTSGTTSTLLGVSTQNPEAQNPEVQNPEVMSRLALGFAAAAVAASPDGRWLYVSGGSGPIGSLAVIDANAYVINTMIPTGSQPSAIAVAPDATRMYVVNEGDSTLTVITMIE